MSIQTEEMLTRVKRIRAAAAVAQKAEAGAKAALTDDAAEACWQICDGAMATILGLILSPDGMATLDAIEARIGGQA